MSLFAKALASDPSVKEKIMSADNGYIIRIDGNGKFVLQMYFASDDEYPSINSKSSRRFNTLQEALVLYNELDGDGFGSEYGLYIDPNCYIPIKKEDPMLVTNKFARKPFYVDAVQVTVENMTEVAGWCKGEVATEADERFVRVKVHRPLTDRQTKAFLYDWVLRAGSGFKVYTDKAFKKSFEEVAGAPDQMTYVETTPATASAVVVAEVPVVTPVPATPTPQVRYDDTTMEVSQEEEFSKNRTEPLGADDYLDDTPWPADDPAAIRQAQEDFAARQEVEVTKASAPTPKAPPVKKV